MFVNKSKTRRWAEHVSLMEMKRNATGFWWGNQKEIGRLVTVGSDENYIVLIWSCKEQYGKL
jgi:hypothetical protein